MDRRTFLKRGASWVFGGAAAIATAPEPIKKLVDYVQEAGEYALDPDDGVEYTEELTAFAEEIEIERMQITSEDGKPVSVEEAQKTQMKIAAALYQDMHEALAELPKNLPIVLFSELLWEQYLAK